MARVGAGFETAKWRPLKVTRLTSASATLPFAGVGSQEDDPRETMGQFDGLEGNSSRK
jgi:hypothetical protein